MSDFTLTLFSRLKAPLLWSLFFALGSFNVARAQEKSIPLLPGAPEVSTQQAPADDGLSGGSSGKAGETIDFGNEALNFDPPAESVADQTRQLAFDAALQGLLPLRPEEIRTLLERFDRTQESVELPVYPAPRPEMAVETLSMDPGTTPKTIKVAYGYVTTLNIVDSTGKPWPIRNITWAGNFEVHEVEASDSEFSNILRITPQSEFGYGNMSISMIDLPTPIIISLETNRDIVHYRYDAIVPKRGPFAQMPLIESGLSLQAGSVDMSAILEGAIPNSAVKMNVSGIDDRTSAYRYGGLTYLRTPLTLLSPGWISSTSSADGMHVYTMEHAPVLLLSNNGNLVRARLSDREDVFDE